MNPLYPEGKLVRDRIPGIIRERGDDTGVVLYVASGEEVVERLRTKLAEEVLEFLSAETFKASIQELGDVVDVVDELLLRLGVDQVAFNAMRVQKAAARGGFSEGHVWVRGEGSS